MTKVTGIEGAITPVAKEPGKLGRAVQWAGRAVHSAPGKAVGVTFALNQVAQSAMAQSTAPADSSPHELSGGAIAGIVIGSVCFCACIVCCSALGASGNGRKDGSDLPLHM